MEWGAKCSKVIDLLGIKQTHLQLDGGKSVFSRGIAKVVALVVAGNSRPGLVIGVFSPHIVGDGLGELFTGLGPAMAGVSKTDDFCIWILGDRGLCVLIKITQCLGCMLNGHLRDNSGGSGTSDTQNEEGGTTLLYVTRDNIGADLCSLDRSAEDWRDGRG